MVTEPSSRPAWPELLKGLWKENPVLIAALGLCPALAVTNSLTNALVMGAATTFVLVGSSMLISLFRKVIPRQVRISVYIIVIATFVTTVDFVLAALLPGAHKQLGAFISLIVVNCLILGRQEAFASKNTLRMALADALGMAGGFTLALSMIGALLALKWSGGSLNVYSQIGLITLVGLITKHGILIVEFTNQLREEGMEMVDALVKASAQRLRPILMTTGAMVLGAIPLALATGAGAETRTQIGWVIVGGMSLGTLLTIFVVPTMYTLFARKAVPGANTAVAADAPVHPLPPHDYVAK